MGLFIQFFFFFKYSFNQWFQMDSPKRNTREWASSRVLWLLSQPARSVPDRAEDSHAGADRPAHKGVSSPRQVERGNRGAPRRPDPWAECVLLLRESCRVHAPVSGQAAGPLSNEHIAWISSVLTLVHVDRNGIG